MAKHKLLEMTMKIYYQYSKCKTLPPKKGDYITEINCILALSKFADVYYSGSLFRPNEKRFGLREYTGSIYKRMKRQEYDTYFVRSNRELFMKIGKNKVKFWNAGNYSLEKEIFEEATAVYTRTETMQHVFTKGQKVWANPKGKVIKNVFVFPQPYGDAFVDQKESEKSKKIRKDLGADFIIGCFGTLRKSNFPHLLINSLKYINKKNLLVKVLMGVTKDKNNSPKKEKNVVCKKYHYSVMPHVISACDLCIVNETGVTWNYLDSLKALEPAACKVPIIMPYADSRVEIMGNDYPLFLPMDVFNAPITKTKITQFAEVIFRLMKDKDYYNSLCEEMPSRVDTCSIDSVSDRVKKDIMGYLNV